MPLLYLSPPSQQGGLPCRDGFLCLVQPIYSFVNEVNVAFPAHSVIYPDTLIQNGKEGLYAVILNKHLPCLASDADTDTVITDTFDGIIPDNGTVGLAADI